MDNMTSPLDELAGSRKNSTAPEAATGQGNQGGPAAGPVGPPPKVSSNWLVANYDPHAGLYTIPGCVCFSDLFGDGDVKLLVGNLGLGTGACKLRVFKGTALITEQTLLDTPTGVVSFYMDTGDRRTPAIAVAAGQYLFIYKNMKPFYKFSLPSGDVLPQEGDAWQSAREGVADADTLVAELERIRSLVGERNMTPRSQSFLALGQGSPPEVETVTGTELTMLREAFIKFYRNDPLKRPTVITVIVTMPKTAGYGAGSRSGSVSAAAAGAAAGAPPGTAGSTGTAAPVTGTPAGALATLAALDSSAAGRVDCIVLGTEACQVVVLEPDAFTVLATVSLPSVPVHITSTGHFDIDYRLVVSCRDANIYSIKRGFTTGRLVVQLNSQPVGLLRVSANSLLVACMDRTLACYTTKGNCMWTLKEGASITALESIEVPLLAMRLTAVALANKQVVFYQDRSRVDVITFPEVITSMRCGPFGRETNALVLISAAGTLIIQIMRRVVSFKPLINTASQSADQSADQNKPQLMIPKKSKLFVDQTIREREEYINIHRTFQHDLYRMKLISARAYARAIESRLAPVTGAGGEDNDQAGGNGTDTVMRTDQVKVSAQVHGLGPVFRLALELRNLAGDESHDWCPNLYITFTYDARIYRLSRNGIAVPQLIPGVGYPFSVRVENVSPLNVADTIKVFVLKRSNCTIPLVTAVVNFPAAEAAM